MSDPANTAPIDNASWTTFGPLASKSDWSEICLVDPMLTNRLEPCRRELLMENTSSERQWAALMRASLAGDMSAHCRFLEAVMPFVRVVAGRRCAELGCQPADAEDVLQEVLLAIHLKKRTWDSTRPISPWISMIVRNKAVDLLRRRGRQVTVTIDSVIEILGANEVKYSEFHMLERMLSGLKEVQRTVVIAVAVKGESAREAGERLGMTEGAVRTSLHRALKTLAIGI